MKKKAVAGISGGVDSAVCAAILMEQGYSVTGVFLDVGGSFFRAEEVCDTLGIPLITVPALEELEQYVIAPFIESYLKCETPNPCVICNAMVKYPILTEAADKLGIEHIATGHYAGIVERDGVYYLRKGHPERDQSYMLYRLPQHILSRCLYPIGDMSKNDVRAKAAELGLAAASAPDSMEICFIPDDDYADFIRSRTGTLSEGNIVDTCGNVLGRHKGLFNYTVGQRRGLGISSAGRLFVVALDADKNQVVLGDGSLLYRREIKLRDMVGYVEENEVINVKVRHSPVTYKATVAGDTVRFAEGARVTPGQSAVFYGNRPGATRHPSNEGNNIVLGGGIIC
jgi:tRNA-specific 2-thiouridylase